MTGVVRSGCTHHSCGDTLTLSVVLRTISAMHSFATLRNHLKHVEDQAKPGACYRHAEMNDLSAHRKQGHYNGVRLLVYAISEQL